MRRGLALLPVLLWSATSAVAQAPPTLPPDARAQVQRLLLVNDFQVPNTTIASPDDVVARLLSFDRNNDGRVTKTELPERMLSILPRGDTDRDEALDLNEIRALTRRPAELTVRGFPQVHGGGYGFADEGSVSSLSHIQGALEDLRLTSDRRSQAVPVVTAFSQVLDSDAAKELVNAMQPLLTEDQLADFSKALDFSDPKRFIVSAGARGSNHIVMIGPNISRRIGMYGLGPTQREQALRAIERYQERLRPGEQDRAALLEQMKGILTDDERDDFRAALERRPVVKAGGLVGGVSGRIVNGPIDMTIRPAILTID